MSPKQVTTLVGDKRKIDDNTSTEMYSLMFLQNAETHKFFTDQQVEVYKNKEHHRFIKISDFTQKIIKIIGLR
jgi:hypothetical protein